MRATKTIRTEAVEKANTVKNVALFLAAPFIGLVYAVLLPFVGIAMLALTGAQALVASGALGRAAEVLKNVALLIAAPFIGLVYAVSFPFVGVAMLVWTAVNALATTVEKAEVFRFLKITPSYQAA
jgi:hypothetical protein